MRFAHCQMCVESATWTDLAGSVGQAIFRSLLGWMSGSMGLAAQGLYSMGDALAKGLTLISVRVARRPPSKTFPFGAGKLLFVTALTVGVMLLSIGIYNSLTSFSESTYNEMAPSIFTIIGIALSASFGEIMNRYLLCVAKENNDNSTIKSAARDNRIDAISSIFVLIGVLLLNAGVPFADHIAALVVSLMMVRIGGVIAWDAVKGLLDVTVSREILDDIARTSRMVKGVQDIKLIRGRSLGEYWELYLHVAIDENLAISEGLYIVANLKEHILEKFPKVQHVWVITIGQKARTKEDIDYWSDHLFSGIRDHKLNEVRPVE